MKAKNRDLMTIACEMPLDKMLCELDLLEGEYCNRSNRREISSNCFV